MKVEMKNAVGGAMGALRGSRGRAPGAPADGRATSRRRWSRAASGTVLALLVGTLVVLAYRYEGKPFTEVDLNDGSVWVTNRDLGLVARLNPQIEELDLGVDATTADFDIFQRAGDLFVDDDSSDRSVKPIDIPRASVREATSLPTGAVVAHGGDTFAVVDPVSGKAWVRPQASFGSFSAKGTPPDLTGALSAAVGDDGRAYVLGRDGTVTALRTAGAAPAVDDGEQRLGGGDATLGTDPALVAMTVVGDVPVLYDRTSGELRRPGQEPLRVQVQNSADVRLQQPAASGDAVYVATPEGLLRAPLEGGSLESVSRGPVQGLPAAPVVLLSTGCVYAAWSDPSSPHNYLRDCADDSFDDTDPIASMQPGARLQFRVNRDVVVLNDDVTGDTWLVQQPGKAKVDNWPTVDPRNENRSKLKETTEEVPEQENRPPEPQDDDLGARPGRSTVLPVVALNDHDPDGDILSISKTQHVSGPELEVRIVGGGTQLQVAVPADATGTSVFRYYVTDGKVNDEVFALVRLRIRTDGQHAKPKLMPDREPRLRVAKGATASYFVLADFYDIDGDDLTLREATARGGEVEFRPDGTITFSDTGAGAKVSEIDYVVDDGIDSFSGSLPVDVLAEKAPPELVPDLSSGVAGTRVVVQPLANDRNPEGTDLTLKSVKVVGDDTGTQVTPDLESGTFTFVARRARSYYLQYAAYNSSATVTSTVRLDIESPPKDNRPPVAVRDKAVVAPGGSTQVDLLLNDLDPDNDVLVVKRVGRPSIPGLKVSVVDKRLAVVSSASDFAGQQATVEYVVSDGRSSTTGYLVITQRPATTNSHPVANKDQVTVRAGSVTTVPVLANDSDPDGGKPRLFQSDLVNEQDLDVWVSGDTLRLRAPDEPGTYSVIYGVRDDDGLKATAELSVFVVPDSAKNNRPPVPQPIIDRVIGGRPKVISVDLVGADPDGDSVALRSILTAPTLGRVVDTGVDWIRYEAFEGRTGTDFFQVLVQDKFGATGVADVRVGVVAAEEVNQPPVALDDTVLVQPDRTITYNVLTNDVDPDDDPLRVDDINAATKVRHEGGLVEVAVGEAPAATTAVTTIGYSVRDAAGARDDAVLKVAASRTAPFYAPIARDDVADLGDIIGREPGEQVRIPVLDNDIDFDGAKADLRVVGCDAGRGGRCTVDDDGSVRVALRATDQVVLYRLDDADEESTDTFGVVYVTGTDNVPPQLTTDPDRVPVKVDAGQDAVIDLTDLVVTRAGRTPSIAPDASPTAVNGAVSPVEGATTSVRFTPARDHVGPASITLAVSDGRDGDAGALTSLLTIPIDVVPTANVAPVMRDAAVDLGLDDEPVQLDLAGLTRDANRGDLDSMTWTATTTSGEVEASVDAEAGVLTLEPTGSAEADESARVEVVATDAAGATDTGTVSVRLVDSDRPLVHVPLITVNADEDEPTEVDLASYAVNPYPGEPITVSSPVQEGRGRLRDVAVDGSVVRFTPSSSGTSALRLRVGDASGDRSREVTARIAITVIDVPDAPARPTLSSVEASSAVLSWREPDANGAPIEEYEVAGPGGFTQRCTATTCRLVDLTPGESYTFTVRARNSEGWSEPSPATEKIVPNRAPDLMTPPEVVIEAPPTGSRMDRRLTLRWTPPTNEGSEITAYEIKEAGSARTWQAAGTARETVIPGLANGTPYAFEIRAINAVEPRRQFSAPSRAVAPFGVPLPSGAAPSLTASEADPYNQAPFVRIDWAAWSESQSNGNRVTSYRITCSGCRRGVYDVDASTTSRTFGAADGITKGRTFTFTVAATNDAGTSDRSPSVSGRPFTKPGPVRNLGEVGSSPSDRTALIGWDGPADDGGLPISHYLVQTDGGGTTTVPATPGAGGVPITFAGNGAHTVSVRVVTRNGDRLIEGDPVGIRDVRTWGKPQPPNDTSAISGDYYSVSVPLQAGGENGQPVLGVQFSDNDGASWQNRRSGEPYSAQVPQGGTARSILVRTVSAAEGDRKYSDAIRVTATSRARDLSIAINCVAGFINCTAQVRGDGFVRDDSRTATVTLSGGLERQNPDSCTSFSRQVSGSFFYNAGGDNCYVRGNGVARVEVDGATAEVTR
ncbi:Ig-like domain-containing protein [Nocardioides sp.]|uniref:Ig-like domain-containing protein n=1 Tax=Nocardioides sp. TaxID=35761 RepID=UPI003513AB49